MAVDKTFLMRSIQKKEEMIVAYCAFTNMPFVVCDQESFNDQVWIFDTEAQLQEFAKPYTEKKILLKGIKYPNARFLSFFSMLFTIGINELVFVGENGKETIEVISGDYLARALRGVSLWNQSDHLRKTGTVRHTARGSGHAASGIRHSAGVPGGYANGTSAEEAAALQSVRHAESVDRGVFDVHDLYAGAGEILSAAGAWDKRGSWAGVCECRSGVCDSDRGHHACHL